MNDRHLNDQDLTAAVRTWMADAPAGQPDRSRVVGEVVKQLGSTRRRRRRWPFSRFRREALTTAAWRSRADQPDPIPSTDRHSPTTFGRTHLMLSPAKAIIAGALVFGIGGVMLIAQPFEQHGSNVPGAASGDPAMAPSFFSGSPGEDWVHTEPVIERREDGVIDGTGEGYTVSWNANDPRTSGTASITLNETDYRVAATTLAPTGDIGSIRTYHFRIVNDDGSWDGQLQELVLGPEPEFSSNSGWLTGTGAYEGLSAYLVWSVSDDLKFRGHITAEGPPPVPDSLPQ
jgi:hypothetical protein